MNSRRETVPTSRTGGR